MVRYLNSKGILVSVNCSGRGNHIVKLPTRASVRSLVLRLASPLVSFGVLLALALLSVNEKVN